ncbi:hypothetical protein [Kingella sp. (in: b-proteobacteria)]|nr:hypothetical protein [Kingella sp. (in: b-proteobacteria)]MDO4657547.1 hypothetical protein [Kingella sp. (in: b-proteobacteria)]
MGKHRAIRFQAAHTLPFRQPENGSQDFKLPIQRTIQQPEPIIQHKEPP